MAIEQYFQEAVALNDANKEDESSVDKWKSVSAAVTDSDNNPSGGFDCNICLELVQDPVVTLCGHLYCWPCIYKWLHFQSISSEDSDQQQQQQQCPVCKAQVSSSTLVPLYGRGQTTKPSKGKALDLGLVIPRRPPGPACGFSTQLTSPTISPRPAQHLHHRNYLHQSQPYYPRLGGYTASPMLSLGGTTTTNVFHPIIGMFGEMFYTRVFGNSVTNLYNYPNSYHLAEISSPRVRRHVMQADKSLSRICFFLFCCIFLCLLLF